MTPTQEQLEAAKRLGDTIARNREKVIGGYEDTRLSVDIIAEFVFNRDAQVAARAVEVSERVAQITAHRACSGNEHDALSKFHGNCVVCLVPFPCEYVGNPPSSSDRERLRDAVIEAVKADKCPRAFSSNVTYALAALSAFENRQGDKS